MSDWQPHHEPLRTTLTRTFSIAIVGAAVASRWLGGLRYWPVLFLVMLWPSLGGHWLDVLFLNWVRPRLPADWWTQRFSRVALWFVGGIVLALGARWTAALLLARPPRDWLTWTMAGIAFVAIELVAHAALQIRGRPSFYNGLG